MIPLANVINIFYNIFYVINIKYIYKVEAQDY